MTVLRCTAKLLKRLKQPAKPPEPEAQGNPLGEWYADIDFWQRDSTNACRGPEKCILCL